MKDKILRGGAWGSSARYLRASYRSDDHPDYRNDILGFRCAEKGGHIVSYDPHPRNYTIAIRDDEQ